MRQALSNQSFADLDRGFACWHQTCFDSSSHPVIRGRVKNDDLVDGCRWGSIAADINFALARVRLRKCGPNQGHLREEQEWKGAAIGALAFLLVTPIAVADTPETGIVAGKVTDASDTTLPGVTVSIEGDRGKTTVFTEDDGSYRFVLLPPGSYLVRAELSGFGASQGTAELSAGDKIQLDLKLALETAETITVTSEAPVIDRFEVTSGGTIATEVAEKVTSANANYYSVVAIMPGVSQDGDLTDDQPTVNGSRFTESSVFIDGVDTTYPRRGGSRMYLPDVATTEVSLQSGGSQRRVRPCRRLDHQRHHQVGHQRLPWRSKRLAPGRGLGLGLQ